MPFDRLRTGLTTNGKLHNAVSAHPEVYPPSAAPEATRVSKGEQHFVLASKAGFADLHMKQKPCV
jgi:hypothetical protein